MTEEIIYDQEYDQYYNEIIEESCDVIYENPECANFDTYEKYYYDTPENVYYYKEEEKRKEPTRKKRSSRKKTNQNLPYYIVPVLYVPKKVDSNTSTRPKHNVPYGDTDETFDVENEAKSFKNLITTLEEVDNGRQTVGIAHKETQCNVNDLEESIGKENVKPSKKKNVDITNLSLIKIFCISLHKICNFFRNSLLTYVSYLMFF